MTKFMKVAAYIVMALGIVAGIYLGAKSESFLVFLLYGAGSFICCLPWFVMVEISEKIDYLSEQISRTERNIKASTAEQSGGSVSNSKLQLITPVSPNVGGKWICPECKEINPASQRTCRGCGHSR